MRNVSDGGNLGWRVERRRIGSGRGVATVKAPDEGGQLYLTVPDPGVGPPLRASVPPQALVVTAVPASIVVAGIVRLVAATAAPINRIPMRIRISGLP